MSKLSPDARHLIDAARAGLDPPSQARARVRARVLARVGAAAAAGSAAALGSSATAAKTAAAGILVKVAAFVGIAGVAAAITVNVDTRLAGTVPAKTSAPTPPAPPRTLPARAPELAATVEAAPTPSAVPAPRPAAPRASAPSASLDDETDLLKKAQAQLRAGHPERALATLDEHDGSGGVLRDERRAERILALCAAGRAAEARAEAQRFLAESPRSPMAARVRSSCAATDAP
jgi:hypothetical protein